jgi:hypothetical protein
LHSAVTDHLLNTCPMSALAGIVNLSSGHEPHLSLVITIVSPGS